MTMSLQLFSTASYVGLRLLDSKEIHPPGEATLQRVAVSTVAAAHADLERMKREGRCREGLYHRLNVVHFRVPHSASVIQNRDLSPKFFEERDTPPPSRRHRLAATWPHLGLEPHHVRRLADGGPNHPGFVAAQSQPPGSAVQSQETSAQGGLVSPRLPWE